MKYITEPVNKKQLAHFLGQTLITDILIGVENISSGPILKLSTAEINYYLTKTEDLKISLDLTRLFHEKELATLKKSLSEIDLTKIKFIFYTDFAILQIIDELGYKDKLKLVYDAYTYTTNALDVNIYNEFNTYVSVSNQISIEELKSLLAKLNHKAIIRGFGKAVIFYSKRKLLTNYFKYRTLKYNAKGKNYLLQEEYRNDLYHIYEDNFGTYIYEPHYYYLFLELDDLENVDYVILESVFLDARTYENIVLAYLKHDDNLLHSLHLDLYKGIMQEKSILLKDEVIDNGKN